MTGLFTFARAADTKRPQVVMTTRLPRYGTSAAVDWWLVRFLSKPIAAHVSACRFTIQFLPLKYAVAIAIPASDQRSTFVSFPFHAT